MLSRFFSSLFLVIVQTLSLIHSSISHTPPPFNLSHFLFPKSIVPSESKLFSDPPTFLQGILDAIVDGEKWALEDIRVSKFDVAKAKFWSMRRYEFRFRIRKKEIVLKLYDQVSEWKKLETLAVNGSNFESLVRGVGSKAVIDSFKIEGPFELRVLGLDDQLSLMLPENTSHAGLRRLLVGEGITVEVKGPEEISLFHLSERHQPMYGAMIHQLELERSIRSNDTYWSTVAEWRTKPSVERSLFDVVARIEADVLMPIVVKKVRPVTEVDSFAWRNLLSNISFTKFPPTVLPPEALTLDVKW